MDGGRERRTAGTVGAFGSGFMGAGMTDAKNAPQMPSTPKKIRLKTQFGLMQYYASMGFHAARRSLFFNIFQSSNNIFPILKKKTPECVILIGEVPGVFTSVANF